MSQQNEVTTKTKEVKVKFFVVGLSQDANDQPKRGLKCPEEDCPRGLIPPGKFGDGDGARGFKRATGTLSPAIAAAAALDFETEAAVDTWLASKAGEAFIQSFTSVIIVRSSAQ